MDEYNIEELKDAKDRAWAEWEKTRDPERAAWKKYEAAADEYKNAVIYEKAKRKVMRDLVKAAGRLNA